MIILAINKQTWARVQKRCVGSTYTQSKRFQLFSEPDLPCITSTHYPAVGKKSHDFDALKIWACQLPVSIYPCFYSMCPKCYSDDLRITSRNQKVCVACGTVTDDQVDTVTSFAESHGAPVYTGRVLKPKLPRSHSVQNVNKRVNHFKYWLARLQGKQTSNRVTGEVIHQVQDRLYRRCITRPECEDIKHILRELRLQRLYTHIHFILYSITGQPLILLEPEHEQQLVTMFRQLQAPFAKYSHRVNMLSYPYVVRKLFEILGWDDAAAIIPLLKSNEKVRNQDVVWREICLELGWPYYRSVA